MRLWKVIALTAASLILAACGTPPRALPSTTPTDVPTVLASSTRTSPPPVLSAPSDTPTDLPTPTESGTPASSPSATPATHLAPQITDTPTSPAANIPPSGGLPDLIVTAWYYATEPLIMPCMDHNPALAVRVCVANIGAGAAGPFAVIEPGSSNRWDAGGLNPGEEICQDGLDWIGWGPEVVVDPYNAVPELHEDNNYTRAGIPTQHPQCTPTP